MPFFIQELSIDCSLLDLYFTSHIFWFGESQGDGAALPIIQCVRAFFPEAVTLSFSEPQNWIILQIYLLFVHVNRVKTFS